MIQLLLRMPPGDVTITARGNDWGAAVQPAIDGSEDGRTAYFQLVRRLFTLQGKSVQPSKELPLSMADLLEGLETRGYDVTIVQGSEEDAAAALTPPRPPGNVTA